MNPDNDSLSPIPWDQIIRFSLLGVLALLAWIMVDVARYGGSNPVSLIQPGTLGPSSELIRQDFPEVQQPEGLGLDGQQYYAIARHPTDLETASRSLDNPRYRLGRPLLGWLASTVSLSASGVGLIWALFAVGLVGIAAGSIASGVLSTTWGGPPWVAALFPLLPGAWWSLRVTVSDALALGLALCAIALFVRNRHVAAIAVAVLAVLAKEPVVLLFIGWWLYDRTKRSALMVGIPAGAIAAWTAYLAWRLPPDSQRANDLGPPFLGLVEAFRDVWSQGNELVGMAATLGGLALGGFALYKRGLRHPLGWVLALQLGFILVMGVNPTSVNFGATRMAMPAMITGVIMVLTPNPSAAIEEELRP